RSGGIGRRLAAMRGSLRGDLRCLSPFVLLPAPPAPALLVGIGIVVPVLRALDARAARFFLRTARTAPRGMHALAGASGSAFRAAPRAPPSPSAAPAALLPGRCPRAIVRIPGVGSGRRDDVGLRPVPGTLFAPRLVLPDDPARGLFGSRVPSGRRVPTRMHRLG